jgi:hypothetical protein
MSRLRDELMGHGLWGFVLLPQSRRTHLNKAVLLIRGAGGDAAGQGVAAHGSGILGVGMGCERPGSVPGRGGSSWEERLPGQAGSRAASTASHADRDSASCAADTETPSTSHAATAAGREAGWYGDRLD